MAKELTGRDIFTKQFPKKPLHNDTIAGVKPPLVPEPSSTLAKVQAQYAGLFDSAKHIQLTRDRKLPWELDTGDKYYSTETDQLKARINWLRGLLDIGPIDKPFDWAKAGSMMASRTAYQEGEPRTLLQGEYDQLSINPIDDYTMGFDQSILQKLLELELEYKLIYEEGAFKKKLKKWILGRGLPEEYRHCYWVNRETVKEYINARGSMGGVYSEESVDSAEKIVKEKNPIVYQKFHEQARKMIRNAPTLSDGFINDTDLVKFRAKTFLEHLAKKIPKTEEEAYLYYKYIVLRTPVDLEYLNGLKGPPAPSTAAPAPSTAAPAPSTPAPAQQITEQQNLSPASPQQLTEQQISDNFENVLSKETIVPEELDSLQAQLNNLRLNQASAPSTPGKEDDEEEFYDMDDEEEEEFYDMDDEEAPSTPVASQPPADDEQGEEAFTPFTPFRGLRSLFKTPQTARTRPIAPTPSTPASAPSTAQPLSNPPPTAKSSKKAGPLTQRQFQKQSVKKLIKGLDEPLRKMEKQLYYGSPILKESEHRLLEGALEALEREEVAHTVPNSFENMTKFNKLRDRIESIIRTATPMLHAHPSVSGGGLYSITKTKRKPASMGSPESSPDPEISIKSKARQQQKVAPSSTLKVTPQKVREMRNFRQQLTNATNASRNIRQQLVNATNASQNFRQQLVNARQQALPPQTTDGIVDYYTDLRHKSPQARPATPKLDYKSADKILKGLESKSLDPDALVTLNSLSKDLNAQAAKVPANQELSEELQSLLVRVEGLRKYVWKH